MIEKLNNLKNNVSNSLEIASLSYFYLGLNLYSEIDEKNMDNFQISLGNISIACELILKTIISRKVFGCLYPNLKKEYQAIIYYPEAMPAETILNRVIGDLGNFSEKTVDINQAISLFYQLYPKKKSEYKPHLDLLARMRNISVHAAFLKYPLYVLERAIYVTTSIFLLAQKEGVIITDDLSKDEFLTNIIGSYDKSRVKKVQKSVETAQKKFAHLHESDISQLSYEYKKWKEVEEVCPVCNSNAISYGYTEDTEEENKEYGIGLYLFFYKQQFKCNTCNLSLEDKEELELAGLDTFIQLSGIEEWLKKKKGSSVIFVGDSSFKERIPLNIKDIFVETDGRV